MGYCENQKEVPHILTCRGQVWMLGKWQIQKTPDDSSAPQSPRTASLAKLQAPRDGVNLYQ